MSATLDLDQETATTKLRVDKPIIGSLMDALNPLVVRITGANINRRTVQNVQRAGLELVEVENLRGDLVKLIHARPGTGI